MLYSPLFDLCDTLVGSATDLWKPPIDVAHPLTMVSFEDLQEGWIQNLTLNTC